MVLTADRVSAPGDDVRALAADLGAWLRDHDERLRPLLTPTPSFDLEVENARRLRHELWHAGWARYGWPEEYGGLGGSSVHRSALYEELYRTGWPGPSIFEHIEIIAPTLVRFGRPDVVKALLPTFLDGSQAWAQGFSESEAGSDLAALRTKATPDGTDFVVNGTKTWTSWAKWARWCLALVRTGRPEERHRGLSMMIIDLTQPGVMVAPIRQANGTDELAQVFLDDVRVPAQRLVGDVGCGWQVAMYLLARERGTLSWLRHLAFRQRLLSQGAAMAPESDRAVGDFVLQWAGVRAAAAQLLRRDGTGDELGAESAFNKLLMTRTEQQLYDLMHDLAGLRIALPLAEADEHLQREFLFSRIVTVYGGSQQMQLITIARHILGLGRD